MKEREKRQQIENEYDGKKFSFTYNNIANINSNPDYNIDIAVQFNAYSINFKSKTNSKSTFNYHFCF